VIAARVLTIYYFVHFLIICRSSASSRHKPFAQVDFGGCAKRKGAAAAIVALGLALGESCSVTDAGCGRLRGRGVDPAETQMVVRGSRSAIRSRRAPARLQGLPTTSARPARFGAGVVRTYPTQAGLASRPQQVAVIAAGTRWRSPRRREKCRACRRRRPFSRRPPIRSPTAQPPDLSVLAKARSYERGFRGFLVDMVTQYQEHGVDTSQRCSRAYDIQPAAGFTCRPARCTTSSFPATHRDAAAAVRHGAWTTPTDRRRTPEQYARDVSPA